MEHLELAWQMALYKVPLSHCVRKTCDLRLTGHKESRSEPELPLGLTSRPLRLHSVDVDTVWVHLFSLKLCLKLLGLRKYSGFFSRSLGQTVAPEGRPVYRPSWVGGH